MGQLTWQQEQLVAAPQHLPHGAANARGAPRGRPHDRAAKPSEAKKGGKKGAAKAEEHERHRPGAAAEAKEAVSAQEWASAATCVVCCELLFSAAVGPCGHHAVCAPCSVRSRVLYDDRKCPLCKAPQKHVVLAALRPDASPVGLPGEASAADATTKDRQAARYEQLLKIPDGRSPPPPKDGAPAPAAPSPWTRQLYRAWGASLLAPSSVASRTAKPGGRKKDGEELARATQLKRELEALTMVGCRLCAQGGATGRVQGVRTLQQLQQHAERAHGRRLCALCRDHRKVFPMEQDLLLDAELEVHLSEDHPKCAFCARHFYDSDQLYSHMVASHFVCNVCERVGKPHQYFDDYRALQAHFYSEHHPCTEPECVEQLFIVFASAQELKSHFLEAHSSRMPRWQPNRARGLQVPLAPAPYVNLPRSSRQDGSSGQGRGQGEGSGHSGRRQQSAHAGGQDGPFRMIDDDLGTTREAQEMMSLPAMGGQSGWMSPWASNAPRQPSQQELFPALPAPSAPPPVQQLPSALTGSASTCGRWASARSAPPGSSTLAQVQVTCTCGTRKAWAKAPTPGDPPPQCPPCNEECARAARRRQLADAFGQSDANALASEQAATAFGAELLTFARTNLQWVDQVESAIEDLLLSSTTKRHSLPPMPSKHREMVHELAKHYSIATHSYGNEPKRHIDLFRLPSSTVPVTRLSQAARMEQNKLDSVIATQRQTQHTTSEAAQGSNYKLEFTDMASTTSVEHLLRSFEGHFMVESKGTGKAIVAFTDERRFKQAQEMLGGGVRGQYRVAALKSSEPMPRGYRWLLPSHLSSSHTASSSERASHSGSGRDSASGWQLAKGTRTHGDTQTHESAPTIVEDAWNDELVERIGGTSGALVSGGDSNMSRSVHDSGKQAAPAAQSSVPEQDGVMALQNPWELLGEVNDGEESDHEVEAAVAAALSKPADMEGDAPIVEQRAPRVHDVPGSEKLTWEDLAEEDDWEATARRVGDSEDGDSAPGSNTSQGDSGLPLALDATSTHGVNDSVAGKEAGRGDELADNEAAEDRNLEPSKAAYAPAGTDETEDSDADDDEWEALEDDEPLAS